MTEIDDGKVDPTRIDKGRIEKAVREILEAIGDDPDREGLRETPERVARFYAEVFSNIGNDPGEVVDAFFGDEHYQEIVIVREIPFYSMCEHHLVPFHGQAHVGYMPRGRVTGLSKLARLVDGFARRPQMQERLTAQVADSLCERLDPLGVIVVIEAEHLCMSMRGVRKPGAKTVTSAVRGVMESNAKTRSEAMALLFGTGIQAISVWKTASTEHALDLGLLVGILNVTPDSFSDGGDYPDVDKAVAAGVAMVAEGATIIDVGGESTRPGAEAVPADEETERVIPVIKGLVDRGVTVSIDTSKPEVAALAIASGASVINDVTGFRNPDMIAVAAVSRSGAVVMHMLGDPRTMQDEPQYDDVVGDVRAFLVGQALRLVDAGLDPSAVVVDPGFGFGKTTRHNLELVNRLGEIVTSGFPVMLGASRKSTLKTLTGEEDPKRRDGHTAVLTAIGFDRGARLFRVHDVGQSRDALRIAAAIVNPQRWEEWQQD